MSVVNLVVSITLVIVLLSCASAIPQPSVVREKYIIHAPIKFKTIHHHKIKKIPVLIKKHIYYYKNEENSKPIVKEDYGNLIENDFTEYKVQNTKYNEQDNYNIWDKYKGQKEYSGGVHQEDYENGKQSEEDYDDYEYE